MRLRIIFFFSILLLGVFHYQNNITFANQDNIPKTSILKLSNSSYLDNVNISLQAGIIATTSNENVNNYSIHALGELKLNYISAINNLKYGIKLSANLYSDIKQNKLSNSQKSLDKISNRKSNNYLEIKDNYLFIDSPTYGRVELGGTSTVSSITKYDTSVLLQPFIHIFSSWWNYVSFPIIYDNNAEEITVRKFILTPDNPIAHGHDLILGPDPRKYTDNSLKISYFSPRIFDMQMVTSYTPDTSYENITLQDYLRVKSSISNIYEIGINYIKQKGPLGFGISSILEFSDDVYKNSLHINSKNYNKLFSYMIGTNIMLYDFIITTSIGNWGKSLREKVNNNISMSNKEISDNHSTSHYYDFGVRYDFFRLGVGASYFYSNFNGNRLNLSKFQLSFKHNKKTKIFAEINNYIFKNSNDVINAGERMKNDGIVFLFGLQFIF